MTKIVIYSVIVSHMDGNIKEIINIFNVPTMGTTVQHNTSFVGNISMSTVPLDKASVSLY